MSKPQILLGINKVFITNIIIISKLSFAHRLPKNSMVTPSKNTVDVSLLMVWSRQRQYSFGFNYVIYWTTRVLLRNAISSSFLCKLCFDRKVLHASNKTLTYQTSKRLSLVIVLDEIFRVYAGGILGSGHLNVYKALKKKNKRTRTNGTQNQINK